MYEITDVFNMDIVENPIHICENQTSRPMVIEVNDEWDYITAGVTAAFGPLSVIT